MFQVHTSGLILRFAVVVQLLVWFPHVHAAEPEGWGRVLGGTDEDYANSVSVTPDGGCIVVGDTLSFGLGNSDIWVVRLNKRGDVVWQKSYGGADNDYGNCVIPRKAGGYYVAGSTKSNRTSWYAGWILRLDARSKIVWQKTYGGSNGEYIYAIRETRDGGLITAGGTYSYGAGDEDFWIMKLTPSGNIVWQRTFGGTEYEWPTSIELALDGGYVVAGITGSFGAGNGDFWIIKLDSYGNVRWQRTYGAERNDIALSLKPTRDGGYVAAGWTNSYNDGDFNIWVIKLGPTGGLQWQKLYKGLGLPEIHNTIDGNYLLVGAPVEIIKLDTKGNVIWGKDYPSGSLSSAAETTQGDFYLTGAGYQYGRRDFRVLKVSAGGLIKTACGVQDLNVTVQNSRAWVASTSCEVTTPAMQTKSSKVGNVNSFASTTDPCQ